MNLISFSLALIISLSYSGAIKDHCEEYLSFVGHWNERTDAILFTLEYIVSGTFALSTIFFILTKLPKIKKIK
jgi:hypothetical protein